MSTKPNAQGAPAQTTLAPAESTSHAIQRSGNGHSNPLVLPESGTWVVGMENLAPEDVQLPYIRLTQSVSDDVQEGKAQAGEFRHSITGEKLPQPLEFVPVMVSITRARFVDRARVCFSVDGITGQGDPGGQCAACPYAQWSTDQSGKRIPPACPKGYQYVCIIPGREDALIALILTKTSAPAARKLNYFIRAFRSGSVFALRAVKEKGPSGYYYRFDVDRARALTAEEAKALLEIRQMLAGKQVVIDEHPEDFAWEAQAENASASEDSPF